MSKYIQLYLFQVYFSLSIVLPNVFQQLGFDFEENVFDTLYRLKWYTLINRFTFKYMLEKPFSIFLNIKVKSSLQTPMAVVSLL